MSATNTIRDDERLVTALTHTRLAAFGSVVVVLALLAHDKLAFLSYAYALGVGFVGFHG